jgi:hypothetical protein
VPRVERAEFVNVGVIVYCQSLDYLQARMTSDLSRVLALEPGLDAAGLRDHLEGVPALCAGETSSGENGQRSAGDRFRWLVAPRSTVVQCAPVHTGLTSDPDAELQALYRRMVENP